MPDLTFEDVRREHMELTGASDFHFTLGPEATPEGLREALVFIRDETAKYNAFTREEQLEAHIARLRKRLGEICKLSKSTIEDYASQPEEVRELKHKIFGLTDLVPDVDLKKDTEWMKARREKRNKPLP